MASAVEHAGAGPGVEALGQPDVGELLSRNARVLSLAPIPKGWVNLEPSQVVRLYADYAVFDVDETQIEGTGEHVHDGHEGRFAIALSRLIASRQNLVVPPSQSTFSKEGWMPYKACAGRAEEKVCEAMVNIANIAFFGEKRDLWLSPQELQRTSHEVLHEDWANFLSKISLIPGVKDLLSGLRSRGVLLGLCSASAEAFVTRVMQDMELLEHFESRVTGAKKKEEDGKFNGDPVVSAIKGLQGDPKKSVMFGDSLSDYAAAALAGVPIIVLRIPKGSQEREAAITSLRSQVLAWQAEQGKEVVSQISTPLLIIVNEFEQVLVGGRLTEGETVARAQVYNPHSD